VRIDVARGEAKVMLPDGERAARRRALQAAGGFAIRQAEHPGRSFSACWLDSWKPALSFQRIGQTMGLPRDHR
jgi:dihydroxy-acid dehydratase